MSSSDNEKSVPRSLRHKQILDVAEENPDASTEELASEVPSATPDLVERVFSEYGDPAAVDGPPQNAEDTTAGENGTSTTTTDSTAGPDETEDERMSDETADGTTESTHPSLDALSEKQREVMRVIASRPDATQREIGDELGVSRATVSNRVNSIEGFEWSERGSFAEAVFEQTPAVDSTASHETSAETASTDGGEMGSVELSSSETDTDVAAMMAAIRSDIERLDERVAKLSEAERDRASNSSVVFDDPELVHKIVRACMDADNITEAEELDILREALA